MSFNEQPNQCYNIRAHKGQSEEKSFWDLKSNLITGNKHSEAPTAEHSCRLLHVLHIPEMTPSYQSRYSYISQQGGGDENPPWLRRLLWPLRVSVQRGRDRLDFIRLTLNRPCSEMHLISWSCCSSRMQLYDSERRSLLKRWKRTIEGRGRSE